MPPALVATLWAARAGAQSLSLADGEMLRGRFKQQRFLQGFNAPLTSTGTFIVVPARGVVWRAEMPFALITVMGRGGLVQRVAGGATTHYPASRMPAIVRLYEIFAAALSGDWPKLDQVFDVQREGGKQKWKVTLTPRSNEPNMPLRIVTVQGGQYVDSVEIMRTNSDWDRIAFTDQAPSGNPLDSETAELLDMANRA